ncbi:MAG: phosphoglycolate phosphatase [bacterium]
MRYQAVFFDLDGTLVDSARDLYLAVCEAVNALGKPQPEETQIRDWVGNGTEVLMKRALTLSMHDEPEAALLAEAMPLFDAAYHRFLGEASCVFEGGKKLLEQLKVTKIPLAIITNKPNEFTQSLLKKLGIHHYFDVIIGGDSVENRKPAPDALLLAAKTLNVDVGQCLMIGDSSHDIAAARNANASIIAVSYGYNHGENIADSKPDHVVDSLNSISTLLDL